MPIWEALSEAIVIAIDEAFSETFSLSVARITISE